MIKIVKGNILTCKAEALINTVNTRGIMGKGIALQFKKAYPKMFKEYADACKKGEVKIGHMHMYILNTNTNPHFIINFPTKEDWRKPSKLKYIEQGLHDLIKVIKTYQIKSIALPPLGCGFGKLSWNKVKELIHEAFANMQEVEVFLYAPFGTPTADQMINNTPRPNMTYNRAIVIKLLEQYKILEYEMTLLEMQKLLYFLQVFGINLNLKFHKVYYGPYAGNLRQTLNLFEGHFIQGFVGKDDPDTPIKLLPQAITEANKFISDNAHKDKENKSLEKVSKLIEGFESPYGMELLASVHWVINYENVNPQDENAVINAVHSWNDRKQLMKKEHIVIALKRIRESYKTIA